jgi:DNA-binding response OmpR family regulator
MRILMVEDDPDILDVTTYAQRRYGHDVQAVTDGAAALECYQTVSGMWCCWMTHSTYAFRACHSADH